MCEELKEEEEHSKVERVDDTALSQTGTGPHSPW